MRGSAGRSPPLPPSCLLRKDAHSSITFTPVPRLRLYAAGGIESVNAVGLRLDVIDGGRVEPGLAAVVREPRRPVPHVHAPVETGTPAGVAGCIVAADRDLQPQRVLVAIGLDLIDMQEVPR